MCQNHAKTVGITLVNVRTVYLKAVNSVCPNKDKRTMMIDAEGTN